MSKNNNRTVVSVSPRKNVEMVIYTNVGEDGRKSSITRHEPMDKTRPAYRRQFKKNGGT